MTWTCATCGNIPDPDEGGDDAFPDDCDSCWVWKTNAMEALAHGLFGWLQ